ncbi:hypothetical protein BGX33_012076 [Mortierella sp. NVP41]|nr:hypothetical protein BGX33_012076 [Mortierella sp. NVP41]
MDNTFAIRTIIIPELVHEIAIHLARQDFAFLTRVSKKWHQGWSPYLWHDIKILTKRQEAAFLKPEVQWALIHNRHSIRSLWCRSRGKEDPLAALRGTSGQLYLTEIYLRSENGIWAEARFMSLVGILEQSPFVETLEIPTAPPAGICVETLLMCVARSLPRLRFLTLFVDDEPYVRPHIAKEFLETCSAELEYLSIGMEFCQGSTSSTGGGKDATAIMMMAQPPIGGSRPHPKLKCFALSSDCSGDRSKKVVPWVLSTFLKGCTDLEVVDDWMHLSTFRDSWIWDYPVIGETLASVLGVRLRQLHQRRERVLRDDSNLQALITSIQPSASHVNTLKDEWHTIRLDQCPPTMPLTNSALYAVAPYKHLAVLSVERNESMDTKKAQEILCQGRSLRCVTFGLPPTIAAADMVHSWTCRWITTLKIQIKGIPRPDIFTDYRSRLAPTLLGVSMKQSRSIQRQVYAQLGALICLRSLSLGADSPATELEVATNFEGTSIFFDRRLQVSSLEMTLESGLGLLSGLRSMERLSVENMEHRIGKEEILWLERSWPNLKQVKGLVRRQDGDQYWGARISQFENVLAPGRVSGSPIGILDCDVGFSFS